MAILSLEDLAGRSGVPVDRVRLMADVGLLTRPGADGDGYKAGDIERVRVLESFEDWGIALSDMANAVSSGALSLEFLDLLFPEPTPMSGMTFGELAAMVGVPLDLIERLHIAFGLPRPGSDDPIREDDAQLYPLLPMILSAGLDEAQVIRGVRVYGENIRRIAQFQVDVFHSYLEEPIRRSGTSEGELMALAARISSEIRPIAERLVMWLYRRHREHYTTKHLMEHAEHLLESAGPIRRDRRRDVAISFLDISGFTRLTEEQGDEVAADLAAKLAVLVQERAAEHRGRPVKWLGDGVMFHFHEPANAVLCGLDLIEQAPATGLPRPHVGINAGPVIFRDSDYFGRTVNVASRIAAFARPGEVLVGDPVVDYEARGVRYSEIGPILLPGLLQPVTLHAASRAA